MRFNVLNESCFLFYLFIIVLDRILANMSNLYGLYIVNNWKRAVGEGGGGVLEGRKR